MHLNKGEVIEVYPSLLDTLNKDGYTEVGIKDINTCKETGAIDITTENGFFENKDGILMKNCSAHSLRAIAMHGLGKFFGFDIRSGPAKHAMTLVGHINTMLCHISSYYAGALGLDAVNVYMAPYVHDMSDKEMKQIAQYLIFSLSQTSYARSGQTIFTDFNVFITITDWLRKVQAVGPGGKLLEDENGNPITYEYYEKTARKFLRMMLEVWKEGDLSGKPMPFPKADCHISSNDFVEPEAVELLKYACEVSSHNGIVYFVFDHDSTALSACCRLRLQIDKQYLEQPERTRFTGMQNVTTCLPACAYRSEKDKRKFFSEIRHCMNLAMKAHIQKKAFIEKLGQSKTNPLYLMITEPYFDGEPYVDPSKATYIFGISGLNEAVKYMTGQELHESDEAHEYGLDVITFMYTRLEYYREKYGLKVVLEESPFESGSRRSAKTDVLNYPDAKYYVQGNLETGDIYYTNSIHFRADADVDLVERITKQSEFHSLIEAGAIIHAFVKENMPSPEAIYSLVEKTHKNTDCAQLVISPDFTICSSCSTTSHGLHEECPRCNNKEVSHMSRVVGYYSNIENWNKSKQVEHKDRAKGKYYLDK